MINKVDGNWWTNRLVWPHSIWKKIENDQYFSAHLLPWLKKSITPDWCKAPIRAAEYTKLSTVIPMLSAPCTPRLWPYLTLDWLGTVLLMNKVGGKLTNYQSGSAFFTIENWFSNDWYLIVYLLPSVYCSPLWFYAQTMQYRRLWIKENHSFMWPNIKYDHLQWYQ